MTEHYVGIISEQIFKQPDSAAKQYAQELLVEVGKLSHELNDPNYHYAGTRIHKHAIMTRNADIDRLRAEVSAFRKSDIICLCGSTTFFQEFAEFNLKFTLEGLIVLSIGCDTKRHELTNEQKKKLDELHLRKIAMSNGIFVINKGGYIGESTRKEIAYANELNKIITYMEKNNA